MTIDYEPYSHRWKDDPYTAYRQLRDEAPVYHAPESGVWCISRHADVEYVLKNPEVFCSRGAMFDRSQRFAQMNAVAKVVEMMRVFWRLRATPRTLMNSRMLILDDGEVHHGLRTIVNRGFTPRRIRVWEDRIRELVDQCMARVREDGKFDLIHDLAIPLPVTVIAEMLGIESSEMHRFKRWSDQLIQMSTGSGMKEAPSGFGTETIGAMRSYVMPIVRARRKHPQDDLISTIVTAEPGDQALSDQEVLMFFVLLLVAGNETTTNLLGNTVDALLQHPEVLDDVVADPALIPGLVEETLRWDNPVQFINRLTTQETELHGTKIPKDARVLVMLGAANRDERFFPEPDRYDPRRDTKSHMGFGYGHHFCLGASLARLEAIGALQGLIPELPRLRRTNPKVEFLDSYLIRGRARIELAAAGKRASGG